MTAITVNNMFTTTEFQLPQLNNRFIRFNRQCNICLMGASILKVQKSSKLVLAIQHALFLREITVLGCKCQLRAQRHLNATFLELRNCNSLMSTKRLDAEHKVGSLSSKETLLRCDSFFPSCKQNSHIF